MDISGVMAQEIIDELSGVLQRQLNFFDGGGYILASTNTERIGHYHAGAARMISEGLQELAVYHDKEYAGALEGYNLPLVMDHCVIGAIGITGEYEQVKYYGQIIKKMTEILLREHDEQQRKKIESRIRSRFLDDWILTEQNLSDPVFLQRARAQEIDVGLSRRVVVMQIQDIGRYSDDAAGQETIDKVNRRVRQMLSLLPGAIFSKTASVMICLLPMQDNHHINHFVDRVFTKVLSLYGIRLKAGADSRLDTGRVSIHQAYQKAMKTLQSCTQSQEEVLLYYDDITYELFLEQIDPATKSLFVSRMFCGLSENQIEEYTSLLKTLYEMDGAINKTADAHYIHKNTLQYKLNKLTKLTGRDPRAYQSIPLYYLAMLFRG